MSSPHRTLLLLCLSAGCAAPAGPSAGAGAAFLEGRFEDAMNELDGIVASDPADAASWALLGRSAVRFWKERSAEGKEAGWLLGDAKQYFDRAMTEGRPAFTAASGRAARARSARPIAWAATALFGMTPESDVEKRALLLLDARQAWEAVLAEDSADPEAAVAWARLLVSRSRGPEAAAVLKPALADGQGGTEALEALDAALPVPRDRMAVFTSMGPASETPALLWYRGRTAAMAGDATALTGDHEAADALFRSAVDDMLRASALRPDFQESARWWASVATANQGWCRWWSDGDVLGAWPFFLEAVRLAPGARMDRLGANQSAWFGASFLIAQLSGLSDFGVPDMEASHAALERSLSWTALLVEAAPDDAGWWRNLGLFHRDLGTALEWDGAAERGREHYEDAYRAYQRAVELLPGDPRAINDCALMLVYHLDRDEDLALAMFEEAIEIGSEMLADGAGEADPDLAVAVGDAWQNIGFVHAKHGRWDEAAAANRTALDIESESRAWGLSTTPEAVQEAARTQWAGGPPPPTEESP